MSYRAPSKYADDRRTLEIRFVEARSAAIQIRVHAKIRPPVWLSQQSVQFAGRRGYRAERVIEVANYGDQDWSKIAFKPDVPWLTATALLLPDARPEACRQLWRVTVHANAGDRQCGVYAARLRLECGTEEASLPVSLRVAGAVQAIPERMFFSGFDDAGRSICIVRLRCVDAPAREIQRTLSVEHDLNDWLRLEVSSPSERFLVLKGVLSVPRPVETVKGLVRLRLNDAADTVIELPLSALR